MFDHQQLQVEKKKAKFKALCGKFFFNIFFVHLNKKYKKHI